MRRRIANIIRRMCDKEDFYTNYSPRISKAEVKEIEQLTGCLLQYESVHGAESSSPIAVYPLRSEQFKVAARQILSDIDAGQPKQHGGARPRSGPKPKSSKGEERYRHRNITLPPATDDQLRQWRQETGNDISDLVNQLLLNFFTQHYK